MLAELVIGLMAGAQAGAAPPQPPPGGDWKVVVAMPVYQPDGGTSVETATIGGDAPSLVHLFSRGSQCETATAGANEPADARFGWRVLAHTVRTSATGVVVSVDWRRMWDGGKKIGNGPSGTVQLTLHPGDRIPLDLIPNRAATDLCRAVGLGLEVKLSRGTAVAPPGSNLLPMGAVETADSTVKADLWLVHKLPAGTERAEHQNVHLPVGGGSITFAPVTVSTPQGDAQVEIAATFRRFTAGTGGEYLLVSMSRNISAGSLPAGGVTGSSSTVIELPGPGDVISLEIPTFRGGSRGGRGTPTDPLAASLGQANATGGTRGGGGVIELPLARQGSGGAGAVATGQGGAGGARARGGGRGGGGTGQAGAVMRAPAPTMMQAALLLEGHTFALRLRMAQ